MTLNSLFSRLNKSSKFNVPLHFFFKGRKAQLGEGRKLKLSIITKKIRPEELRDTDRIAIKEELKGLGKLLSKLTPDELENVFSNCNNIGEINNLEKHFFTEENLVEVNSEHYLPAKINVVNHKLFLFSQWFLAIRGCRDYVLKRLDNYRPQSPLETRLIGGAYLFIHQYQKSIEYSQKARMGQSPKDFELYIRPTLNLIVALIHSKQAEKALELMQEIVIDPTPANWERYHYHSMLAYTRLGKLNHALNHFQKYRLLFEKRCLTSLESVAIKDPVQSFYLSLVFTKFSKSLGNTYLAHFRQLIHETMYGQWRPYDLQLLFCLSALRDWTTLLKEEEEFLYQHHYAHSFLRSDEIDHYKLKQEKNLDESWQHNCQLEISPNLNEYRIKNQWIAQLNREHQVLLYLKLRGPMGSTTYGLYEFLYPNEPFSLPHMANRLKQIQLKLKKDLAIEIQKIGSHIRLTKKDLAKIELSPSSQKVPAIFRELNTQVNRKDIEHFYRVSKSNAHLLAQSWVQSETVDCFTEDKQHFWHVREQKPLLKKA